MKNDSLQKAPGVIVYFMCHIQAFKTSLNQLSLSLLATWMTFAVIGISLALPMGLFVALQNSQIVVGGMRDTAQISLYLKMDVKQSQVNKVLHTLDRDEEIMRARYISPAEGLREFQTQTELSDVLGQLKQNPLPGVIIVYPEKSIKSSLQVKQLLSRLQRLPYVQSAELDMVWLQRLSTMIKIARRVVFTVMILFALAVLLIIGNTIRLITQNHKNEIEVVKLLGGTERFIRRPFLYSGIIYGVAGGIIAWLLVDLAMWWLSSPIQKLADLYNSQFQLQGLNVESAVYLLIGGAVLGYLGSWLAVGRHIK
jgi:cell division transport system permease protein